MAAGSTYTPIATTTLGSAQASYTFSSISGSYTDLVLIADLTGLSASGTALYIQVNSDSGSNYSSTNLAGSGTAASSSRTTSTTALQVGAGNIGTGTANQNVIINLMNYSNTTTFKSVLARWNDAAKGLSGQIGLWRSTSAITSVTFLTGTGTINSGSTFTLYGIAAA
jgi:hypothetical protein